MNEEDPTELLARVSEEIGSLFEGRVDGTVAPSIPAAVIRGHLESTYGSFAEPIESDRLIADVARMLRDWNIQVTHRRYFGLFNPSVHPSAVAAEALVAAFNPQLAAWAHAAASCEIERHTLRYLGGCLGLEPDGFLGTFTTGGAEANHSAVLVALTHAYPDYGRQGLASLERRPSIYVSADAHHSLEKVAHMVGLGRSAVRTVPSTNEFRMDVSALRQMLQSDRLDGFDPLMVVGTAGTTGAGSIDPLPELAELASHEGLWFHVDAAWGGTASLSSKLRPALAGVERADSVTWDAHKWLSAPMGAGMFFCTHPHAVLATFGVDTPYIPEPVGGTLDPYSSTIQWSRRHIGLKVFMALSALGAEGVERTIDHQARVGDHLRDVLQDRGWKVVNETPFPLVCFTHDCILDGTHDAADLAERLCSSGFWVSELRLGEGPAVLRASITSFRAQNSDVEALVTLADELISRAIGLEQRGADA